MKYTYDNNKQYGFGDDLMSQVSSAATGGLGAIMGLPTQMLSNWLQGNQQQKFTEMQLKASKDLSAYNMGLQYDMWNKTNYPAQVEQLNKAGLNPALLYGSHGGGGTTTGSPSGSVGMGIAAPNQALLAQQAASTAADINLKNAQAENLKANTAKTQGVDTDATQAGIDNMKQQTQNAQIQNDILHWESGIKSAEATVATKTIEQLIQQVNGQLELLTNNIRATKVGADLSEATKEQLIQQAKNTTMQQGLQMILTKAQTEGVITDIQATKRAIINAVQENMRKWDQSPNMSLEQQMKEFQNDLLQNQTLPNMGEKLLESITHFVIPLSKGTPPVIKPMEPVGFKQKW